MIPTNSKIPMTHQEVIRFRREMSRRMKGDLTPEEQRRKEIRAAIYRTILANNGGQNPLFTR